MDLVTVGIVLSLALSTVGLARMFEKLAASESLGAVGSGCGHPFVPDDLAVSGCILGVRWGPTPDHLRAMTTTVTQRLRAIVQV